MEQKEENVGGSTRYVKIGNSVFDRYKKDTTPTRTICECLFCGDRFGGDMSGKCAMYCKRCKTADGRKKVVEENEEIKQENLKKGFIYA